PLRRERKSGGGLGRLGVFGLETNPELSRPVPRCVRDDRAGRNRDRFLAPLRGIQHDLLRNQPLRHGHCLFTDPESPISSTSSLTGAVPEPISSISFAAASERSMMRSSLNGPRSLIRTTTAFPECVLVTLT